MNNKNKYFVFILFLAGIVSRLPFLEMVPSHWDGADWSISVVRYSLFEHTPTPPGYPIYIAFGKLFYLLVKDPHLAIVLVSVLFSGVGAAVVYSAGDRIFNKTVGLIASFLFLTGPTFYFFGITANPYGLLTTTATLFALLTYQIMMKRGNSAFIFGAMYAIAVGIRPQDAIFLTPLFIYGLYLSTKKYVISALIASLLVGLFWLVPLLKNAGGLDNYLFLLKTTSDTALPGFSLEHLYTVRLILLKGLFLSFGLSLIFLLTYLYTFGQYMKKNASYKNLYKNKKVILFFFWITPSLLFNMFVRSDHAAHQMTYLSALLLLIAYGIWLTLKKNKYILWLAVFIVCLFNLYTFFRDRDPSMQMLYIPQSYHYSEIKKIDVRLPNKNSFIEKTFKPSTTYIISTEAMFKPYSYYLKSYDITALTALDATDAPYKYERFDTKNWNLQTSQHTSFITSLPKNTVTVLLLDDDASVWVKNYPHKTYALPGNSRITTLSVKPTYKIAYGYHTIKIIKY